MTKRIFIGTGNPSKLKQMRSYFADYAVTCLSPADVAVQPAIPEDGRTAEENALQKALAWHQAVSMPVLTEDSGLVFLDLPADHPDQPGVRVRRVNNYAMTDAEMLQWYQALAHRHGGSLRAAYQNAWCLCDRLGRCHLLTIPLERLAQEAFLLTDTPCEERKPGWPLDSLSICPSTGRYYAQMSAADFDTLRVRLNNSGTPSDLTAWIAQCIPLL